MIFLVQIHKAYEPKLNPYSELSTKWVWCVSWEHQYLCSPRGLIGTVVERAQSAGSFENILILKSPQTSINSFNWNIKFKFKTLVISKFVFLEKTIKEALKNEAKYERHLSEVKTKNFRYSHLWILSKNCPILLDSFFKNPNNRRRKSSLVSHSMLLLYIGHRRNSFWSCWTYLVLLTSDRRIEW